MPLYQSKCGQCQAVHQEVRSVSRYQDYPVCCGEPTKAFITEAPMSFMAGRFEPFKSIVDGSIIRNKQDLANHNARNNVVSVADGYDTKSLSKLATTNKKPDTSKADAMDLSKDIYEATKQVEAGYKPTIGVYTDD